MANFSISFKDNLQFTFTDSTSYGSIAGEADSELVVKYPSVLQAGDDGVTLDLYNENIASFGDDFIFVIADEDLDDLVTGVYEFTLNIYDSGGDILETKTKYYINPYDIQSCLRLKTDNIMDNQCDDLWCEVGLIGSLLDVAIREAADDRYSAAQEIIDYLVSKCNEC